MVRIHRKILFALGAVVIGLGSGRSFAGTGSSPKCSSTILGSPITIAVRGTGDQARCYQAEAGTSAQNYGTFHEVGFLLSSSTVGVAGGVSCQAYAELQTCLKLCPKSVQGAEKIAQKCASHPSNTAITATNAVSKATKKKEADDQPKANEKVAADPKAKAEKSEFRFYDLPDVKDGENPEAKVGSDYATTLATMKTAAAKRTGVTRTTLNGESVTLKTTDDGGVVGIYNSGAKAGQWFDPETKQAIHSSVEYSYDGKTYHSLEDAKAANLDKKEPGRVTVTKYDESGKVISSKTLADAESDGKKASAKEKEKSAGEKYDECQRSVMYAKAHNLDWKKYKCNTTYNVTKAADISNQVLTGVGRTVVNQMGASAAASAQTGSLASSQDAAAKMAKTSFTYETALGAANLAATVVLQRKAQQHKQNLGALESQGLSEDGANVVSDESGGLLSDSRDAARLKLAKEEQLGARNMAAGAAFKTAMVAAQSIAGAIVAKKTQKAAEANARLARENEIKAVENSYYYDPNQLNPPASPPAYDPNTLASTANSTLSTSSDGGTSDEPSGPMLGNGTDLGGGSDALDAPKAGAFKAGAPSAPGGGGGGGAGALGAGGGSGGGPSGQEESKAAYASDFGAKERYESAGSAGGKGGAAKGAKDDAGIDLNGLLAQFLPKADDAGPKNGILDSVSFGGNRNVASEEAPSYLDKNADLFQRIHETMSEKNRRGQLGI